MKICSKCKTVKSLNAFHNNKRNKDGKQNVCKECNIARVKQWQENNPEKYEATWRKNQYGDFSRLKRRAATYGITVEQLQLMIEDSGGVCEICSNPPRRWLVVDHCHTTGKVRGILCEDCNQALGMFKDNTDVLVKAIAYLNK